MPTRPSDRFTELLNELEIEISESEIGQFARFLDLLYETNQKFNLTGVREIEEAWERHILDSLTLLPILQSVEFVSAADERPSIADVGSGGGLPGIPLAIALPEMQFTLIESTGKKATFLSETVAALGLNNVSVLNDRAEDLGAWDRPTRESFDSVVARAVGPLNILLELTVPLAKPHGLLVFIKGQKADVETREAERAAETLRAAHIETIPTPTGRIVIYEKEAAAPRKYPRKPGEPKRHPL